MPQIRIYLSENNPTIHELAEKVVTIGRLADNTIQIEDGSVSSHHAELVLENGKYHLNDKNSTNGTFVNGEQVTNIILKNGDQVRFGNIESAFVTNVSSPASLPLPKSEKAIASLNHSSVRPANFANVSPFPKPKEKIDSLTLTVMILAAIGLLSFLISVASSLMLQLPA